MLVNTNILNKHEDLAIQQRSNFLQLERSLAVQTEGFNVNMTAERVTRPLAVILVVPLQKGGNLKLSTMTQCTAWAVNTYITWANTRALKTVTRRMSTPLICLRRSIALPLCETLYPRSKENRWLQVPCKDPIIRYSVVCRNQFLMLALTRTCLIDTVFTTKFVSLKEKCAITWNSYPTNTFSSHITLRTLC